MASSMTEAEILEEIRAALDRSDPGPDDAFTGREWADKLGWSRDRTNQAIRKLLDDGVMERTTIQRVRMDLKPTTLTGYRLARKSEGAA